MLPDGGTLFVSVKETDRVVIEPAARLAEKLGFKLIATSGTTKYLTDKGIKVEQINKVAEGRPHIVDRIKDGDVDLIFNTTEGWQSLKDSKSIRAAALNNKIPIYTTATASNAVMQAIEAMRDETLEVRSLQSYYKSSQN